MKLAVIIVVLLSIVVSLFAAPQVEPRRELVGANPCTWGPAYWCENRDNANKCEATEHCEKKVWGQKSS